MPLLLLGIGLVTTNNSMTMMDDEATILSAAVNPVRTTLFSFFSGAGQHEHPPLYDLILHFWLRWTGGNFDYLRLPSILFFLAGLFLLGRAARQIIWTPAGNAVIWVGVLWPFGFYYGRLATWYSFSFFLVAGLTLSYLKYLEDQTTGRLTVLYFSAPAWCGRTISAGPFLLASQRIRFFAGGPRNLRRLPKQFWEPLRCYAFASFLFFQRFARSLPAGCISIRAPRTILANMAFSVFSLSVSESVAPWYWWFSVPAGLAVLPVWFWSHGGFRGPRGDSWSTAPA